MYLDELFFSNGELILISWLYTRHSLTEAGPLTADTLWYDAKSISYSEILLVISHLLLNWSPRRHLRKIAVLLSSTHS